MKIETEEQAIERMKEIFIEIQERVQNNKWNSFDEIRNDSKLKELNSELNDLIERFPEQE